MTEEKKATPTLLGAEMKAKNARLAAVIDIGASAIRMEIAEIGENGELRTLEQLRQG